jgi:hypothetical protein
LKSQDGRTAKDAAKAGGHKHIVKLLRAALKR